MVVQNYSKFVFVLIFFTCFCWLIIFQIPDSNFHLITCDVGQGDSTLAIYKNYQILTDGGPPNGKVEKCLSNHLPFWDRQIEVVVNTHPQLDHYGGLIKVFENYQVDNFVASDTPVSTKEYEVLLKAVGGNGSKVTNTLSGTNIRYSLILYDIFWPIKGLNPSDTNDISIQSVIKFGEFEAILTGDIGDTYKDKILEKLPNHSYEYIKVPHHGSRNSLLQEYLRKFMPKTAVISSGKGNSYGHPHKEILDLLNNNGVKILRTDEIGDVEIVTNGKVFWVEN